MRGGGRSPHPHIGAAVFFSRRRVLLWQPRLPARVLSICMSLSSLFVLPKGSRFPPFCKHRSFVVLSLLADPSPISSLLSHSSHRVRVSKGKAIHISCTAGYPEKHPFSFDFHHTYTYTRTREYCSFKPWRFHPRSPAPHKSWVVVLCDRIAFVIGSAVCIVPAR